MHRQLVEIHPFNDRNSRAARLLMNLVLIRAGYPPISVRPVDCAFYIAGLQESQDWKGVSAFDRLLYERLNATLAEYLTAAREALPTPSPTPRSTDRNPPHP